MAESQQHSPTKVGQLNVKFYQGSSGAFRSTTDYLDSLLAKYGNKGAGSAAGGRGAGYYPPATDAHSSPGGDYIHHQQQQQQQHTQQHQFQQEGLPQQYPYQQAPASPYSRPSSYNPGGPYGPPSPYGGYPPPHHQPQYEHHGYPSPHHQPQYEHHGYPPPQQQPQHGQYGYPPPQHQPQHGHYGYPPHHHQSQYGQYGYPPPQQQPQHGQYDYPPPQQPPYQQYDPPRTVGIADRMRELEELRQKIMQGPGLKTDSSSPEVGLNSSYGSSLTRSQVTAPVSGEVSPERTPPPEAAVPKQRPRRTRNGSSLPPSQVASIMASPLGTRPPSRRQSETGGGQPGTPSPPPPPGGPGAGKRRPSRRGGSSRATSRGLSPESSRPVSPLPLPPDTTPRAPWSDAEPQEAPVGREVEEERAAVVQVAMSTIREEASRLSEDVASAQLSRVPTTFTDVTAAARSQVGTDAATTNATDAAEVGVTPSAPPPPKPTEGQEDEKGATEGGARKTDTDGEEDVEPTDPPVEEPPSAFDTLHAAAPALCRPLSAQQSQRSAFGASAGDEQAAGPEVTGDDVELGESDDEEEGAHGEGEDGGGEKSDEGFGMALVMEDDGEKVGVDEEEEGDLDGIEARLTALLSKGAESSKSSLRKKSGRTGSGRQKSAGVVTGDGEVGGGAQEAVQQSGVEANESARPELRVEVTSPASRWPGSSEHVTSVPMMEQRREQARPAGDPQKQAPVRSDTQSTVERSRPSSAVDRNPSRASSSRSAAAPVAAVVAQVSAASLREQAEKERAMELYRRAIRGKSTPTSTTSSPRRAAQETQPMPQRSTSHPTVAGSTGQRASSSGRHRPPQPSDVPRKEYTKQSAVPDGRSAARRNVKSATGSPYTRVKSATRPPRRPASSTPHYAEEPHDRPIRSARSNARPPSAAVRELFKDDPVPLFAVSLSRAPRAKGPRRVVSANDALRKAALHAEAQATRVAQRFHSASPAASRQRQSSPARSPRSSTVRRSLVRSAWSENSEVDSGIPFHEAAARMQNEVDTKISALGCIMEERGKANKDLQFGSAMSNLLGAGTLQTALHPPDSPPSRRRVQSAAPTSGGKHSSGNVRPPSARPSPSAAARPQSAHPTTGAAAAREARPSHGAGHGRLGNATAPLRAASNNDGKEAKQCRGAHPVGDASRAEKSIRRVDTIATKWKLDESGEKYDVINNWQVDYDPKTLAALQRTHSKEVVKTAADSEASARMNLSSRSLAPSMRHTWWGGVNEDDAERLWSLSRQQSGAQEGARLTAAD